METGERSESVLTTASEAKTDSAMVCGVRDASEQAGRDGPVDEADDAVVTDHEVF